MLMDKNTFARVAATSILHNMELHISYRDGLVGVIHDLVTEGSVKKPFHENLKNHFCSFPFVRFEGMETVKNVEYMKFSFDMEAFQQSEEIKAYTREYVKDMESHAKKLEKQAAETRQKGKYFGDLFLSEEQKKIG